MDRRARLAAWFLVGCTAGVSPVGGCARSAQGPGDDGANADPNGQVPGGDGDGQGPDGSSMSGDGDGSGDANNDGTSPDMGGMQRPDGWDGTATPSTGELPNCPVSGITATDTCRLTPDGYTEHKLTAGEAGLTRFGRAIALGADELAVMTEQGVVFVFVRQTSGEWQPFQRIPLSEVDDANPNTSTNTNTGTPIVWGGALALSRDLLVTTHVQGDNDVEEWLSVFGRTPSEWTLITRISLGRVAFSSEGTRALVVGNRIGYLGNAATDSERLSVQLFDLVGEELVRLPGLRAPHLGSAPDIATFALDEAHVAVGDRGGFLSLFRNVPGMGTFELAAQTQVNRAGAYFAHVSIAGALLSAVEVDRAGGPATLSTIAIRDHALEVVSDGEAICRIHEYTAIASEGLRFVTGSSGYAWAWHLVGDPSIVVQEMSPADESPDSSYGTAVATQGTFTAIGAPSDDDWGLNSGSVYVYESTGEGQTEICHEPTTVSLAGDGLACVQSGNARLPCPSLPATVDLQGMTPVGPLEMHFGHMHQTDGFTQSVSLRFSSMPVREDTLPVLSFEVYGLDFPGDPIETELRLQLCDQEVSVPATVALKRADPVAGPLEGVLETNAEGWSLNGTFRFEAACTHSTDI